MFLWDFEENCRVCLSIYSKYYGCTKSKKDNKSQEHTSFLYVIS